MKKISVPALCALAAAFAAVSVLVFLLPGEKSASFYTAYGFTAAAFALQPLLWILAPGRRGSGAERRFLSLPTIQLGAICGLLQLLVLAVYTAVPGLPAWGAAAAGVVLLGVTAAGTASLREGRRAIEDTEARAAEAVSRLRALRGEVERLAAAEQELPARQALEALAEQLRYSDPVCPDDLAPLEQRLAGQIAALADAPDRVAAAGEASALLEERNRLCRLRK